MNPILKIFLASICATTMMTAFSYAVSFIFKKNYKEPVLLNWVLDQLQLFPFTTQKSSPIGWILHYSIGLGFTLIALLLLDFTEWQFTRLYGISFGFVAGILGILGWMVMFKFHTYEPRIDVKGYFTQLLTAHIIFGWSLALFFNNVH